MKLRTAFTAALLAGLALPTAANAAVKITNIAGNPGFETGKIIYFPGGIGGNAGTTSANVYVGGMTLKGVDTATNDPVSFDTYCIDILNYLHTGSFNAQAFALSDLTKQTQIEALLSNTAGYIASAATLGQQKDISAGIQMAVWEIAFENGTSNYSLSSGDFRMGNYGSVQSNAIGLGQSYLDNLGSWSVLPGFQFGTLTSAKGANQSQIYFNQSAVPEPATWALMILGFGMVGGVLRKQRKTTNLAFA
ncbi:PEPxxWA-CTERM sorting domain-containing protein [Porphyrobacter algicida]|uniref:PEPxxWA-CTERM sorting domain-containing protein n=1 Tax=Qipengyuania algicida TaxID=1836209 RepID=A0A845AFG3_9SPHN|nr:PEPxxWA-CTERM sorting domain-containing protein [Qipengyuania algicida]MXP28159.1 PEPxxWA-CTERM sorting domain-containing protein [Qipengyuania algicida]